MVDPVSLGVGAGLVAAALQSPAVAKLAETVSAGLGKAVEPLHRRRMASAEADALVTMAHAQVAVREIERRAAERILSTEVRRQENIEAIVDMASKAMPEDVSEQPVSPDWTSRFFDACQDVSNDDMRLLWAKVLAGEVAEPRSYSLRTLNVLRNLHKEEALAFEALCAGSLMLHGQLQPLIFDFDPDALRTAGLGTFDRVLMPLADAGLLRLGSISAPVPPGLPSGVHFDAGRHGRVFVSIPPFPVDGKFIVRPPGVSLGEMTLTSVGTELARLTVWAPTAERMQSAIRGWQTARHSVAVEYGSDGAQ